MNSVMEHIDSIMANHSFQPFHYASAHSSRILSGEEEGVFAWIAVNYLLGVFSNDRCKLAGLIMVILMITKNTKFFFFYMFLPFW